MNNTFIIAHVGENGNIVPLPGIFNDFTLCLNAATKMQQNTFDGSSFLIMQAIAQVSRVSTPVQTTFLVSVGPAVSQ